MDKTDKEFEDPAETPRQLILPGTLEDLGRAANEAAALHTFQEYKSRIADHTLRRQKADLELFRYFIFDSFDIDAGDMFNNPEAWRGITWGLVEAFVKWQLSFGYAVSSVNIRLSSVKTYATLAMKTGNLDQESYIRIKAVKSYTHKEQVRIDQKREITRVGSKKDSPVFISRMQARALKSRPDTPQGRRDAVLICLLLDHGLRVGEVTILTVEMFDLSTGQFRFHRPKVDKVQIHRIMPDTLAALSRYQQLGDMFPSGPLLRSSKKNGELGKPGMSDRAITRRVNTLGKVIDPPIYGLSAHDCRHYWATNAARAGTDPFALQQAGGWSSLAMPRRYVDDNEIANEGLLLDPDE